MPEGCFPGMEFAVSVEGTTFNVTVPDGVSPGDTMTVEDLAGALTLSLDEEVLKRLCIANEVHCSSKATSKLDREKELLQRLQSVAKHGRPGPCPRCESILRVVSDDDGLRLECPTWRGGEGGCAVTPYWENAAGSEPLALGLAPPGSRRSLPEGCFGVASAVAGCLPPVLCPVPEPDRAPCGGGCDCGAVTPAGNRGSTSGVGPCSCSGPTRSDDRRWGAACGAAVPTSPGDREPRL